MTLHEKIMLLFADSDWKGYLYEIFGNPVFVDNCKKGIDSIEISGNYLDGIGVGDGTPNLFDDTSSDIVLHGRIDSSGNGIYTSDAQAKERFVSGFIPVTESHTYSLNTRSNEKESAYDRFAIFNSDKLCLARFTDNYDGFTVPEGGCYLRFTGLISQMNKIVVIEGTNAVNVINTYKPYESTRFVNLNINGSQWSCCIPQRLNCRNSINLFKNKFIDTPSSASMYMDLKPNTTYTVKLKTKKSVFYIYSEDENGEKTRLIRREIGSYTLCFSTNNTGRIQIYITKPSKFEDLDSWLLIEGQYTVDTIPEYEPYGNISDKLIINPIKHTAKFEINSYLDEDNIPRYKAKEIIDITDLQDWESFPPILETTNQVFISSITPPSEIKYQFYSNKKNNLLPIINNGLSLRFDGEYNTTTGHKPDSNIWMSISDKSILDTRGCIWNKKGINIPKDGCVSGTTKEIAEYTMDFVFTTDNIELTNKKISVVDKNNTVIIDICDYAKETTFFISIVANNNLMKVFKDGLFVNQADITEGMLNNNGNVILRLSVATDDNWSGVVHMCNIYNAILDDTEIEQNYNYNKKRYGG